MRITFLVSYFFLALTAHLSSGHRLRASPRSEAKHVVQSDLQVEGWRRDKESGYHFLFVNYPASMPLKRLKVLTEGSKLVLLELQSSAAERNQAAAKAEAPDVAAFREGLEKLKLQAGDDLTPKVLRPLLEDWLGTVGESNVKLRERIEATLKAMEDTAADELSGMFGKQEEEESRTVADKHKGSTSRDEHSGKVSVTVPLDAAMLQAAEHALSNSHHSALLAKPHHEADTTETVAQGTARDELEAVGGADSVHDVTDQLDRFSDFSTSPLLRNLKSAVLVDFPQDVAHIAAHRVFALEQSKGRVAVVLPKALPGESSQVADSGEVKQQARQPLVNIPIYDVLGKKLSGSGPDLSRGMRKMDKEGEGEKEKLGM